VGGARFSVFGEQTGAATVRERGRTWLSWNLLITLRVLSTFYFLESAFYGRDAIAPSPPTPVPRWGRGEMSGGVLGLESPSYEGGCGRTGAREGRTGQISGWKARATGGDAGGQGRGKDGPGRTRAGKPELREGTREDRGEGRTDRTDLGLESPSYGRGTREVRGEGRELEGK